MAKKCAIRSLSDSSLAEVANIVVSTIGYSMHVELDRDISITIVEIKTYLEIAGANGNIYQDLLRVILASDYLEASLRFNCLQMLLNCGVQYLVTEVFPFSYYENILQVIAAQGTGLRILNLKGVWVKDEHMHYMFEIMKKCQNLKKLYIPYIANDELLEVIGRTCTQLQLIDISGETDITEIGVEYLSKGLSSHELTVVDVGMPGEENICYSDIAMILEHCPNVQTLATYSYVGPALKFLHDNIDKDFQCKLKYLHDTGTDAETLRVVVKTCPKLESLYLDTPKKGILHILNKTFLRRIKIYKFQCNELMNSLEKIGRNLAYLTMIKGDGNLDIEKLIWVCPMLIDLDCYMMEILSYSCIRKFEHLEGLEMLSSPMNSSSLKNFIANLTSLRRIAVDSVSFEDEDITSIFLENNFTKLEDVWFTRAPNLTVNSVQILMEYCPELQSLGQLSGWSLTPDDLALIRGLVKSGNSCLVLSPTTFFP